MNITNCTLCFRDVTGPPFFYNKRGWLVCFDCLSRGATRQDHYDGQDAAEIQERIDTLLVGMFGAEDNGV